MLFGAGGPSEVALDVVPPRGMLSTGFGPRGLLGHWHRKSCWSRLFLCWGGDKVNGWDVGAFPNKIL